MAPPVKSKIPQPQPADDGLDKIPMKKMSPAWVIAGILGVVAVGGIVVVNLATGKKGAEAKTEAGPAPSAEPEQTANPTAQREHQAMTERALAALEAKKKDQAAAEASSQPPSGASGEPTAESKPAKAAVRRSGGGPAPKAADLDKLGDSFATH